MMPEKKLEFEDIYADCLTSSAPATRLDKEGISAEDKTRYDNALRRESQGSEPMKLKMIKEIESYDADTYAADGTVIRDTTNRTAGQFRISGDIPIYISPSGSLCLNKE